MKTRNSSWDMYTLSGVSYLVAGGSSSRDSHQWRQLHLCIRENLLRTLLLMVEVEFLLHRLTDLVEALLLHRLTEALPLHRLAEALPLHRLVEALPLHRLAEALPLHRLAEALPLHHLAEALPLYYLAFLLYPLMIAIRL